ncbi:MAG TPA: hypothetical protein ENK85_03025 [Saprospiraceae bacterium]|nr:hypothetical protein [Saprospiraceae bacterium]
MSKFYFLLFFLGLGITACQTKEVNENLLYGHWQLKEGFRNNNSEPSKMLEGIYFNIEKPTAVSTNFSGIEENGQFGLEKDKFTIETSRTTKFKIKNLSEKELELATIIRGIPFRFILEKE